jgi:hypothetical protein
MAAKAKRELLLPAGRKNAAARQGSLKHDVPQEFRDSPLVLKDPKEPTYLGHPGVGFKKSLATAALDLPGTKKAQIGRLVHAVGYTIGLYGLPHLYMTGVRSADMNRTPDIRTRAILPEWACYLTLRYVRPILTEALIVRLVAAAGMYVGVGDHRSEKGAGDYGSFRIVDPADHEFQRIVTTMGRGAQMEFMTKLTPYDDETEELFGWYTEELDRRQVSGSALPKEIEAEVEADDEADEDAP